MENLVCEVCGVGNDKKIVRNVHGHALCSKHKAQYYRYGRITDATPTTTNDKNDIVLRDTYAEIVIRDKKNEVVCMAKIDLDDVDKVSKYKWRLEGNYINAQNTKNGKIKLHRLILDYDGDLLVDHINRDVLDNRKCNLRVVPAVINSQNRNAKHIRRTQNGRFRVEVTRFNKYYSVGTFDTEVEAIDALNSFLEKISKDEGLLCEQFEDQNIHIKNVYMLKNGKYIVMFIRNNKRYSVRNIDSVEDAIAIRDRMIYDAEHDVKGVAS